jgi:hypothetical protein
MFYARVMNKNTKLVVLHIMGKDIGFVGSVEVDATVVACNIHNLMEELSV